METFRDSPRTLLNYTDAAQYCGLTTGYFQRASTARGVARPM